MEGEIRRHFPGEEPHPGGDAGGEPEVGSRERLVARPQGHRTVLADPEGILETQLAEGGAIVGQGRFQDGEQAALVPLEVVGGSDVRFHGEALALADEARASPEVPQAEAQCEVLGFLVTEAHSGVSRESRGFAVMKSLLEHLEREPGIEIPCPQVPAPVQGPIVAGDAPIVLEIGAVSLQVILSYAEGAGVG